MELNKDEFIVSREFVVKVDSVASYIFHRHPNGIPQEVLQELGEVSGEARAIYESKR